MICKCCVPHKQLFFCLGFVLIEAYSNYEWNEASILGGCSALWEKMATIQDLIGISVWVMAVVRKYN